MKVVVIGCTHAGTAAIVNIASLHKDASVTVYERNDNISFLSCGIALYVEGVIKDQAGLFYCSPQKLAELGVVTHMRHDVLSVDLDAKKLRVRNLETGEESDDTYDKLIITTGSWPIQPKLENSDLGNILLCKNYAHSKEITEKTKSARRVAVVGAGYIGTELVEAFQVQGKEVLVVDMERQILPKYLDAEFVEAPAKMFAEKGVKFALGESVKGFKGRDGKVSAIVTDKGEYEADMVILCIGFRPNTELFRGKLDMLPNGAIKVDEYMHTSRPDVFAAGDSATVWSNVKRDYDYIPLATNAVRMGMLVARNLVRDTTKYLGTQATSGIKIYDLCIGSTGLSEESAKKAGLDAVSVTYSDNYRPEFMPTYENVKLKIVFERVSRRILGAQIMSKVDLTPAINTVSVCIQNGMTVDDLAFVDFFFQPHFNKPWNFLNAAAHLALPPVRG
ncbi:MAG: FAD-dependent oxidoreductase [Synergistaceae bacterium]|jgi:NADPH-dependent 2,4-dienoyl-CoA reductase/sulfur reductase-like enzyme|nr:FAD-dependent oxidoreductase [Synergistaceae bacterium]